MYSNTFIHHANACTTASSHWASLSRAFGAHSFAAFAVSLRIGKLPRSTRTSTREAHDSHDPECIRKALRLAALPLLTTHNTPGEGGQ